MAVRERDPNAAASDAPDLADGPSSVPHHADELHPASGELGFHLFERHGRNVYRNKSPNEIYVARNGESELTSVSLTEQQVRDLVERMLKSSGRRLDMSSPFVDAALPSII